MMTDDEIIAVVQARKAGKPIQCHRHATPEDIWLSVHIPSWDFADYDYRAKPEPREFWIVLTPHGVPYGAWPDQKGAEAHCYSVFSTRSSVVHVREVID